MIKTSIECEGCNKLFPEDSKEIFTFCGNVNIGLQCGVIGNCIDEDGKVYRELHYCVPCTLSILGIDLITERN